MGEVYNLIKSKVIRTFNDWESHDRYIDNNDESFNEPQSAYVQFQTYCRLSPNDRSISRVSEVLKQDFETTKKLSIRWRWIARVLYYDAAEVEKKNQLKAQKHEAELAKLTESRKEAASLEYTLGVTLLQKIMPVVGNLNQDIENIIELNNSLPVDKLPAMTRLAMDLINHGLAHKGHALSLDEIAGDIQAIKTGKR